jgi:DNA helicase-2/ATP-dependent DNA helicase PcrA
MSSEELPEYLRALNPEQLQAVRHEGGPLLILAGAGSGKTRVITTKIAYLVREKGVAPESILAVTFTNKAAREMRDRAASIEPACERSVIRTFHSFGAWFLRRNVRALSAGGPMAGIDPNFVIYDDDDQTTLLHGALPQYSRSDCSRFVKAISKAKDYCLEPDSPELGSVFSDPEERRIYAIYEERLRATGNVDFGDLIRLPARILRDDEAIRSRTRQRFRVILVDEYQDSNVAQFELLRLLAGGDAGSGDGEAAGAARAERQAYLCVVGDDDQSIYRFRGAEIQNILSFPQRFPGTTIVRLERNYRSYQSILDLAGNVVSHNAGRLGKELRAERGEGKKPKLALLEDEDEEVLYCAKICEARRKAGGNYGDVAILYRTNAQSLSFEKSFPKRGIPYRLVGALRFYEREEVKDILAYLAILLNGRDEVAFKRVVNKPSRGVGDTSVEAVLAASGDYSGDLIEAAAGEAEALRGRAKTGIRDFAAMVREFRGLLKDEAEGSGAVNGGADGAKADTDGALPQRAAKKKAKGEASLAETVERIVKGSGLLEYHRGQDEVAGTQKAANLDELVNAASLYPNSLEGLTDFLETIELDRTLSSGEETADAVTLITMHNTKGLEFPVVIVTGLEQGLFPREDDQGEELEEQRRLFYVAITRAKDELYLSACHYRRLHGRLFETLPSRFLTEIDSELISAERSSGASRSPSAQRGYSGGYSGYGPQGPARPAAAAPTNSSKYGDSPWRAGQAVYHEDYGSGVITQVKPTPNSGPLVIVRFETGKMAQFFTKFTTKLEVQKS